jgi:DNA-binding XRE family transcriptional regulator
MQPSIFNVNYYLHRVNQGAIMKTIFIIEKNRDVQDDKLKCLGERLRQLRIARHEMQQRFADRLGVSRPTLGRMESGDPGVSIGAWVKALELLDRLDEFDLLLAPGENLFEKYEQESAPRRKRVSRKLA